MRPFSNEWEVDKSQIFFPIDSKPEIERTKLGLWQLDQAKTHHPANSRAEYDRLQIKIKPLNSNQPKPSNHKRNIHKSFKEGYVPTKPNRNRFTSTTTQEKVHEPIQARKPKNRSTKKERLRANKTHSEQPCLPFTPYSQAILRNFSYFLRIHEERWIY